jgi:PAS domain S-box-containing protein
MTLRSPGLKLEPTRLELALDAAGIGAYEWDVARDVFTVSPRLAEMTGLPAGPAPGRGGQAIDAFVHPDDLGELQARRATYYTAGGPFQNEFRIVRPDDGRIVWVRVNGTVVKTPSGETACVSGVVQDVSERRREDEQRQHLMAELDHRVKNVLAAVQALAQQTAKRTTSLSAFLQTFGGRLKAMASANELLTAARWRGAAVDHLVAAELGALAPGQPSWAGPELFLTPRAANALSLALHELATNAVKFGALSQESGHVEVRWHGFPAGGFELVWTESGGPTVAPPARRGFGSTLLEQVTAREINGSAQVEYRPAGVSVRLRAGAQAVAPRPENVPEVPTARVSETVTTARGPTNLRGSRVLIVEDAVLLALELETGLSEAGAEIVGPAYELEEAMALLDRPIDAAVLDANLNGRSVMPVAEALFKRKVPFVFATGYGETGGAS